MKRLWEILRWMIVLAALASVLVVVGIVIWGWSDSIRFPDVDEEKVIGALLLFGVPAALGTPFVMFLWAEAVQHARRRRGQRLLSYVESAVRLDAPLPEMVRAMAGSEKPTVAHRLRSLGDSLSRGEPLSEALRFHVPEITGRQIELLGVAERSGRLRQTLADLVRQDEQVHVGSRRWIEWLYPLAIAYVLALMLSGFLVFVAPKFKEIFADFDTALPAVSDPIVRSELGEAMFIVFIILALLGLAASIWALVSICASPRPGRSSVRQVAWDAAMALPLIGPVFRDRQLADVCYAVASSVRAAVPLPSALLEAGSLRLSPSMRQSVVRWAQAVRGGQPVHDAAAHAGLPRLMVGMLATGQASAQPGEAFEFLHRYYSGRFSRAAELLRAALVPAGVLLMGSLVGWIVLGAFLPLVVLINQTAVF